MKVTFILKDTSICWSKDMRSGEERQAEMDWIWQNFDQSSFLLTALTSGDSEKNACVCWVRVRVTHAGEVKQEAWEAWETPECL